MKKSFVIVGCGFLGHIIAQAYKKGLLEHYEFLGAYSNKLSDTKALVEYLNEGEAYESIDDLLQSGADFLLETASIVLLKEIALEALKNKMNIVPLSIGAFADDNFYDKCMEACKVNNVKIHIPSGAVGGFDVLLTMQIMAQAGALDEDNFDQVWKSQMDAEIHTHKNPRPLMFSKLDREELRTEEFLALDATAAEAIEYLPTQVNVMVATSLVTKGPKDTGAKITTVPNYIGDDHRTECSIDGVKAIVDIYSATSDIAAWSVVALLRNLASPMQFF